MIWELVWRVEDFKDRRAINFRLRIYMLLSSSWRIIRLWRLWRKLWMSETSSLDRFIMIWIGSGLWTDWFGLYSFNLDRFRPLDGLFGSLGALVWPHMVVDDIGAAEVWSLRSTGTCKHYRTIRQQRKIEYPFTYYWRLCNEIRQIQR